MEEEDIKHCRISGWLPAALPAMIWSRQLNGPSGQASSFDGLVIIPIHGSRFEGPHHLPSASSRRDLGHTRYMVHASHKFEFHGVPSRVRSVAISVERPARLNSRRQVAVGSGCPARKIQTKRFDWI